MRLVSLILAMFILAISMLMMSLNYRNVLLLSQDARLNDNAQIVAEEKFTELKTYAILSEGNDSTYIDNFKFVREWRVLNQGGLRKVTITVSWKTLKGSKTIQFSRGI